MTNPDYLKCPRSDTVIEIRTDEAAEKSPSCKKYCKKKHFLKRSTASSSTSDKKNAKLKKLMRYAKKTGGAFGKSRKKGGSLRTIKKYVDIN
jgi:hypothetical protein